MKAWLSISAFLIAVLSGPVALAQDAAPPPPPPAAAPAPVATPDQCTTKTGSFPAASKFTAANSCDASGYCSVQTCWHGKWYSQTLACNQRAANCPPGAPE